MVDFKNVTDDYLHTTTDGFLNTSANEYKKGGEWDETADGWLQNSTAEVSQNSTIGNEIATDESSNQLSTLDILTWTLSPFILTCNGLTIIVVVKFIKKQTPTHVVIAFLAFAGLFVGMIPLCDLTFYLLGDSVCSKYGRYFIGWFFWAGRTLNISTILLIAVERCILLTLRQWYLKYLTVGRQVGLCLAFCVFSLLFTTIFVVMADFNTTSQALLQKKIFLSRNVILPVFTFKTCIIAICYLAILVYLWKHRKTVTSSQNGANQQNVRKEKKTTVLIIIILTLYMVGTYVPLFYYFMAHVYPKIWHSCLFKSFHLVWCAISLLDTFIYAWKVPEFQKGYRKILCCLQRSRIIHVAPAPNVRINLSLEPRR